MSSGAEPGVAVAFADRTPAEHVTACAHGPVLLRIPATATGRARAKADLVQAGWLLGVAARVRFEGISIRLTRGSFRCRTGRGITRVYPRLGDVLRVLRRSGALTIVLHPDDPGPVVVLGFIRSYSTMALGMVAGSGPGPRELHLTYPQPERGAGSAAGQPDAPLPDPRADLDLDHRPSRRHLANAWDHQNDVPEL